MKLPRSYWLTTLILILVISSSTQFISIGSFFAQTIDEENQGVLEEEFFIEKAVEELYIKGLQTRNFDLIRTICVPETKSMSAGRGDQFHVTTLEKWSKRFDPKNPPFQKLEYSIVKIDQVGTAAQVKILFIVDSKRRVIDFLHMLKLEGEWRIVNIINF